MIAPPARPDSACGTEDSTLNSAMAAGGGYVASCPNCPSLLSTPSSVKLLLVGRAPLTASTEPPDSRERVDSVDVPEGLAEPFEKFPPPPSTPTEGRVTPGESPASSVKLRCGMGR